MTTTQTDEIKTWQQRLEETCPALGPMHIHARVEEVNDAMQAEINDLRVALQALDPQVAPHLQFTAYRTDDTQAGTL